MAKSYVETTPFEPKWLSQVPFNPAYLDLNVETSDIKYVSQSLKTVTTKWHNIGIALGIPVEQLDVIACDHRGDVLRQLNEMIACWIHNCELHTWRTLIEALFELGHKTAVSAAIRCVSQAIMKTEPLRDESVQTRNWSKEAKRRTSLEKKIKQKFISSEKREKELLKKICGLLNIPSNSNNELLLDNINVHISRNRKLTYDELREIVHTVKILSEEYRSHSNTLSNWVNDVTKDMENIRKFRA